MLAIILKRLLQGLIILFLMTLVVFLGINQVGDPLSQLVSDQTSAADIERIRQNLNLDKPIMMQYLLFLKDVIQGHFGNSFVTGESAANMVMSRLPATIDLTIAALIISVSIGIPVGLIAGLKPHSLFGRTSMALSIVGFSIPMFWFALIAIMVFAVIFPIFPSGRREGVVEILGYPTCLFSLEGWRSLFLPAVILSINKMCLLARLTRASVIEAASSEHVKFAYAKGVSKSRVVRRHILRNVWIPIITVMGTETANLIAFSVVIETIFLWPGIGSLLINSIYTLDRPVIMTQLMLTTTIFVLLNLIVDIAYAYLDPRIRDLYRGRHV